MTKVSNYKGADIYFNGESKFYCNPQKNDGVYINSMFKSEKITSIHKAIDNYICSKPKEETIYLNISEYSYKFDELKVISIIGRRMFFDDGTDTLNHYRRVVYPKKGNENNIARIEQVEKKVDMISKQIAELNNQLKDLRIEGKVVLSEWNNIHYR